MKNVVIVFIGVALILFGTSSTAGCTRNIDYVKANAEKVANDSGWEIVGYEGFQWTPIHGGYVWYVLQREGSDTIYNAVFFRRVFTDEIHIADLKALNAVSGH